MQITDGVLEPFEAGFDFRQPVRYGAVVPDRDRFGHSHGELHPFCGGMRLRRPRREDLQQYGQDDERQDHDDDGR